MFVFIQIQSRWTDWFSYNVNFLNIFIISYFLGKIHSLPRFGIFTALSSSEKNSTVNLQIWSTPDASVWHASIWKKSPSQEQQFSKLTSLAKCLSKFHKFFCSSFCIEFFMLDQARNICTLTIVSKYVVCLHYSD